jgi:hypothetical protein
MAGSWAVRERIPLPVSLLCQDMTSAIEGRQQHIGDAEHLERCHALHLGRRSGDGVLAQPEGLGPLGNVGKGGA